MNREITLVPEIDSDTQLPVARFYVNGMPSDLRITSELLAELTKFSAPAILESLAVTLAGNREYGFTAGDQEQIFEQLMSMLGGDNV